MADNFNTGRLAIIENILKNRGIFGTQKTPKKHIREEHGMASVPISSILGVVEVNPLCGQRRSLLAQIGSSNNQTMLSRKFLIAN